MAGGKVVGGLGLYKILYQAKTWPFRLTHGPAVLQRAQNVAQLIDKLSIPASRVVISSQVAACQVRSEQFKDYPNTCGH